MAGPTPVSALIHAATMVTTGIYMIARTHELWHLAENASMIAAWIGALTAFFAATIALVQTDLKKILAYSTISQLGYMMLGVGVGAYGAAIFHICHPCLLQSALIPRRWQRHARHPRRTRHPQDGRPQGQDADHLPHLSHRLGSVGGSPPLAGFFSKDGILLGALVSNPILYAIGLITSY